MTWATDRRLDYIGWRLATHGEVQRADLTGIFGVSEAQASGDLGAYDRAHPGAMAYDKSAKRYVPAGRPKRHRSRDWDAGWESAERKLARQGRLAAE